MDIKDKMLEALNKHSGEIKKSGFPENIVEGKAQLSESLTKICEDEMIRFAEWFQGHYYRSEDDKFKQFRHNGEIYTIAEILEIFKQSNNT